LGYLKSSEGKYPKLIYTSFGWQADKIYRSVVTAIWAYICTCSEDTRGNRSLFILYSIWNSYTKYTHM